jgi:PAS domain S-box-containing protein
MSECPAISCPPDGAPLERSAQLVENEQSLAAVFEQAAVGVGQVDLATGRFMRVNQRYCEMVGYTREEMERLTFAEITHPQDVALDLENMVRLRKGCIREFKREKRYVRKDGAVVWVSLAVSSVGTSGEAPASSITIAQDITERMEAEQALKENARFTEDVLNSLTARVAVLNEHGTIIEVNEAWRQFGRENGVSAEQHDFVGANYMEVCAAAARVDDDALARETAAGLRELLAGTRDHFILEYPCHSPIAQRWFKLRASRLTGSRKGAVVSHQDITERKLAEDAQRDSEARFRQLAESINQVFWLFDRVHRRYLYVSPAYDRIWGRPVAGLLANAQEWQDGIHPDERERVADHARTKAARGETYDQTYRIIRPDGSERWVHDRGFPVRDEHGSVIRVAGLVEDITEQRKLEAQFLRSQRMESIGTLAGGIAHDLNNVLSPILMSLELLRQEMPSARSLRLLDMMETSAKRGAGMVKQVLTFARGMDGERVQCHPKHLLHDLEQIVFDTFPRAVEIVTEVAADCNPVVGDVTQLQQVLLNLCVNSRDAMTEGGRLTVSASNLNVDAHYAGMYHGARPGPYVVFQVTDTGSGIPQGIINKIFDPFFTTKAVGKGTGLGLSTVQAIVKSHDGFVHVYSEPGRGTTFKIYLPSADHAAVKSQPATAAELPRGNGELVLIVDDEEPIRHVTKNTLEAFGYRVLVAQDGAEAVALFAQYRDDVALVLTDMMMPILDGAAAILAMRHIRPDVRIIATSGLSSLRELAKGIPDSVKFHLPKPYTADKLLQNVASALRD